MFLPCIHNTTLPRKDLHFSELLFVYSVKACAGLHKRKGSDKAFYMCVWVALKFSFWWNKIWSVKRVWVTRRGWKTKPALWMCRRGTRFVVSKNTAHHLQVHIYSGNSRGTSCLNANMPVFSWIAPLGALILLLRQCSGFSGLATVSDLHLCHAGINFCCPPVNSLEFNLDGGETGFTLVRLRDWFSFPWVGFLPSSCIITWKYFQFYSKLSKTNLRM